MAKAYRKTLLQHLECCYNSSTSGDKVEEYNQIQQPNSQSDHERVELEFCHQGRPIMTEYSNNHTPVTTSPDLIDNQLQRFQSPTDSAYSEAPMQNNDIPLAVYKEIEQPLTQQWVKSHDDRMKFRNNHTFNLK